MNNASGIVSFDNIWYNNTKVYLEVCIMGYYDMSMQTITAYKYRIIDTKTKEPIVSGDGSNDTIDIAQLLSDFSSFMERTQLSSYSQKVLSLEKTENTTSTVAEQCVHFRATSGRYGQRTVAINIKEDDSKTELGTDNAICHFYNVFFYIENSKLDNICIFHRYGRGGCKTIFLELFNRFLVEKELKIVMSALVSPEQESIIEKGEKTKIRLLKNTTKENTSSDIADKLKPSKRMNNNTEMELTINLKNKNIKNKLGDLNDVLFRRKTVGEVFEIPDNFDYNEAKVEMKIGNQTKTISLEEIGQMLCECDITRKLEYDAEKEPTYSTISREADAYYSLQKEKGAI